MSNERPVARVYGALKEKIMTGHYSPSESLVEAALVEEYGVSRNTARKAILMLEQDGLVTVEPNKSARVRSFSKKEVLDFLAFRQVLEGFIVHAAAARFTEADLNELTDTLAAMEQCMKERRLLDFSRLNQRFHSKIFEVCPNKIATGITTGLKDQMRRYNARAVLIPGRVEQSHIEHCAILDALRNREADRAEREMRRHLSNVKQEFEDNYDLMI